MIDFDKLAAWHADSFTSDPAPWSAGQIRDSLAQSGSFILQEGDAFLIGRVIVDESELLTLAVAPESRRKGIARRLVAGYLDLARERGAANAYLEVAEDNLPALQLYLATGWRQTGKRPRYYGPVSALIMTYTFPDIVD